MRYPVILAGGLLASTLSALPAAAQTAPPLAYIQPLPPQAVQDVQDRLRQAGTYSGRIDGIWGADSQSALERFQQTHQLQVTGQLNQATAATLGLDPNALLAVPVATPPLPPADQLRPASERAIQARLRSLGFYNGVVDGVWGPATEGAILRYQQANSLQPNGQPNPSTITAMGLTPDVLAYR
jgi:peptidoglycan hydrolase-like protein with peptidoglycan-binding domain